MTVRYYISPVVEFDAEDTPKGLKRIGSVIETIIRKQKDGFCLEFSQRINRPEKDWALVRVNCADHTLILADNRNKLISEKGLEDSLEAVEKTSIETKIPVISKVETLGDALDKTMQYVYNNSNIDRTAIVKQFELINVKEISK